MVISIVLQVFLPSLVPSFFSLFPIETVNLWVFRKSSSKLFIHLIKIKSASKSNEEGEADSTHDLKAFRSSVGGAGLHNPRPRRSEPFRSQILLSYLQMVLPSGGQAPEIPETSPSGVSSSNPDKIPEYLRSRSYLLPARHGLRA